MALELAEAGLITLQEVLDGLDQLEVPLPEVLRDQVGPWCGCQPGSGVRIRGGSVTFEVPVERILLLVLSGKEAGESSLLTLSLW